MNDETNEQASNAPGSMQNAYAKTSIEQRVNKIEQKLFWYDNLPEDDRIVEYVKEWRECLRKLKALNEQDQRQERR